jgi:anaphase-promoting complex subunit 1
MASVTSLGLHQPTGLQYAIQERLLPPEPPSASYEWHNHFDGNADSSSEDDELLVTPRCVIWCRGGVFRKSYKFDLEKEEVSQALLTTFPSVGPLATKERKSASKKGTATQREAAIVVFLKTQAHVYFLSGTSHVIHLPFEVESACAAPNGLIIQRKLRVDNLVPASLKFPKVPPNSFVSSQPQPWSAASSQLSTFSIADLGAPKQMLMPHSTLKDMWDPPALKNDSNWPRLFSLSDPLAEMGLVVAQPVKSPNSRHRRSSTKITALDTAEEILHVSRRDEFSPKDSKNPLILALTLNRETSMYTVWKVAYAGEETSTGKKQRIPSGTMSRRRSSFVPGAATGATTPVMNSQQTFRESLGVNQQELRSKKNIVMKQDESRDKVSDFASTLDPDFENTAIPRRKSRRVSSMLARADLSASHERSAFSELATGLQHSTTRRAESLGSQHPRTSIGTYTSTNGPSFHQASHFNSSLNTYPEAPVDELLDELRAGGDFEGFHNMGLDDEEFDGLKQEVIFTKVCNASAEHTNVRYSSQHLPASTQCKIFTLTAPPSAADDKKGNTIVICALDVDEKKLLVLTLFTQTHKADIDLPSNHVNDVKSERDITVVSLGQTMRADDVIDACRIDDGAVSRILLLTQTPDGYGELSLQAPWCGLMKVPLPAKFAISNIRNISHDLKPRAKREGGFKRVLSQGPRALRGLKNSKPRGLVDLVDDEGKMHQLQILLQSRNPHVCKILEVCRAVLPGTRGGEGILNGWWNVMQWLRLESIEAVDTEWTALVIVLLSLVLSLGNLSKPVRHQTHAKRKSKAGLLRSSSGAQSDLESWEVMQGQEAFNGNPLPSWADNPAWKWLTDGDAGFQDNDSEPSLLFESNRHDRGSFVQRHVKLAREFASTKFGQNAISTCLPTSGNRGIETRKAALVDIVTCLHLLREEQRLDTTAADSFSTGVANLSPVLAQVVAWLGWDSWKQHYEFEDASLLDMDYDTGKLFIQQGTSYRLTTELDSPIESIIPQLFECPSIYDWIQNCFATRTLVPFMTLPEMVATRSPASSSNAHDLSQWSRLTPRTLILDRFFSMMRIDWSPAQFVEALFAAGVDLFVLETLPEAILAPFQEAIVQCQNEPPMSWSKDLLALVGREDVNTLLTPGQRPQHSHTTILVRKSILLIF